MAGCRSIGALVALGALAYCPSAGAPLPDKTARALQVEGKFVEAFKMVDGFAESDVARVLKEVKDAKVKILGRGKFRSEYLFAVAGDRLILEEGTCVRV